MAGFDFIFVLGTIEYTTDFEGRFFRGEAGEPGAFTLSYSPGLYICIY